MAISLSTDCKYFTLQVGVYDTSYGTFTPTSKVQTVDYYQKCSRNSVYLTWLNSLAMWEYWDFQGQSEKGFEIADSQKAIKNTFEDWDNNFVNQETEEFYRYIEAYESELVRTQRLTDATALAISRIKYSIQVQEIKVDNSKVTVLVDKSGGFFSRDNRKGTEFGITIRRTGQIPIQGQ
jgi:hypothetical protein